MYILAALLVVLLLGGCAAQDQQPYYTHARRANGLVIVLSGIEGRSPLNEAICRGLVRGGVDMAIENYEWAAPMGLVFNQRAKSRNLARARDLADHIVAQKLLYPRAPVYMVAQSGGSALAAWAAAEMPADLPIDGIIMINPSLSPGYDLGKALSVTRQGIINFYSPRDWLLLGIGTTLAGTMDGKHTSSAGRVGFEMHHSGVEGELYRKVYQIGWEPAMAETGHGGGHMSSAAEGFVAAYVSPFIGEPRWSKRLVGEVLRSMRNASKAPELGYFDR
jgi:hypothetical protein